MQLTSGWIVAPPGQKAMLAAAPQPVVVAPQPIDELPETNQSAMGTDLILDDYPDWDVADIDVDAALDPSMLF
jgi:hypothetical protein